MSVNEKMTALADEIRELSGTTSAKSLDAMVTDVGAANTEIAEQTNLLMQIITALEGKAGGSSENTIEYEIIHIPEGATSANYTLSRVTRAIGYANFESTGEYPVNTIMSISNNETYHIYAIYENSIETDINYCDYQNGVITFVMGAHEINCPIELLLINDPSADAISS